MNARSCRNAPVRVDSVDVILQAPDERPIPGQIPPTSPPTAPRHSTASQHPSSCPLFTRPHKPPPLLVADEITVCRATRGACEKFVREGYRWSLAPGTAKPGMVPRGILSQVMASTCPEQARHIQPYTPHQTERDGQTTERKRHRPGAIGRRETG